MPRISRKNWLMIVMACMALLLPGCSEDERIDVVFFEPNDYQVYLYSDADDENLENSYLSAIINLKITHPEIVKELITKKTSDRLLRQENIDEYPTLLIKKDGKTISILSGEHKKKEILSRLEEMVILNGQYSYFTG